MMEAGGRGPWRRALWAAFLSLIFPGVGQVFARAGRAGAVLFVAGVVVLVATRAFVSVLTPTAPALVALAVVGVVALVFQVSVAVDAARRVRRFDDRARLPWFRSTWFLALLSIGLDVGVGALLPTNWASYSIPSGSMMPTLMVGDVVMADLREAAVARGEVVVFALPRDPSIVYVKRVVGLPGDRVAMRAGVLVLNGVAVPRRPAGELRVDEGFGVTLAKLYTETLPGGPSYVVAKLTDEGLYNNVPEVVVPDKSLFVMGDNRDNSADSRQPDLVGLVPVANVIGRPVTVFWSRDRTRILRGVRELFTPR